MNLELIQNLKLLKKRLHNAVCAGSFQIDIHHSTSLLVWNHLAELRNVTDVADISALNTQIFCFTDICKKSKSTAFIQYENIERLG